MIECVLGLGCLIEFFRSGYDPACLIAAGLFAIATNLNLMKGKK